MAQELDGLIVDDDDWRAAMALPCQLCEEAVTLADDVEPLSGPVGLRAAHRECLLRAVLGGIGHLSDHHLWCNERGDPDGGLTYRASALAVDEWVMAHHEDGGL